jgi:hypothetical protein
MILEFLLHYVYYSKCLVFLILNYDNNISEGRLTNTDTKMATMYTKWRPQLTHIYQRLAMVCLQNYIVLDYIHNLE